MKHLMNLELKKNKINKYIMASICVIVFSILIITISLLDSAFDPRQSKDTYENTFQMIGILLSFMYICFYGILVSSFIIKEYNTKTILLMFSYPVERKKQIIAKLLVITIFIAVSMCIGYVCSCAYIIGVDYYFDLLGGDFHMFLLRDWLITIVSTIIVCICAGLWTFHIGIIKKSVPVTLVSSVVLIFIRQVALSSAYGYTENVLQSLVVVIVTFVATWYVLHHKINEIDS